VEKQTVEFQPVEVIAEPADVAVPDGERVSNTELYGSSAGASVRVSNLWTGIWIIALALTLIMCTFLRVAGTIAWVSEGPLAWLLMAAFTFLFYGWWTVKSAQQRMRILHVDRDGLIVGQKGSRQGWITI
jgi:hypothetical protein